uniref:PHD finger protein 1-like n=1 Tax=Sinocyclocheilus rhinocerous TaxID=307959 RepID=A0A673GVU7_9TELE
AFDPPRLSKRADYSGQMGGVSEGEDVLARWSDGLLYLGNIIKHLVVVCTVNYFVFCFLWSVSSGGEKVCCICDAPPLKEPLVNCLKCRHGYHPECHTPPIEPEVDPNSWICRQCVFAVATKRGGALKRGRFARLMQIMKVRLPYQLSSLDWDPQHLTNQQQCYCYCAGPGEWNLKMLQCGSCGQWFHEACTQCLTKPLLYGDRFYQFQCSVCTNGPETIQRLPMTWVDLAHLVLYHLSLCCKRKYFDFGHEIMSFANENWESLLLGTLSDTPRQDRCQNLLNALNSHKDRFVSGKEIKKKKCLFGLQVRAPPPLSSDQSPFIAEQPINITHRRRSETGTHQDLLISTLNSVFFMYYSSPPKRMYALYHPSCNGSQDLSRTLHHYRSDPCRLPAPCLPFSLTSAHPTGQRYESCPSLFLHDVPPYPSTVGMGGPTPMGWGGSDSVRILARRITPDGKVQYLVEWGNVNVY